MSLTLTDPQHTTDSILAFLSDVFYNTGIKTGVIAVSGGIDSALSLTLLVKTLGPDSVIPILLPYHNQDMSDAEEICRFNGIPSAQWAVHSIGEHVDRITRELGTDEGLRKGNIMARVRMIMVYDIAKSKNALVCGTENKSENHLGYFTRFGDEASDIEPIQHLYKTQVRQLCGHLGVPDYFITKAPSAGLWDGQTDETEMGFTYDQADRVMEQYIDGGHPQEDIHIDGIGEEVVKKIIERISSSRFKHEVPYRLEE